MPISLKNTGSILPYIRYSPQNNVMTIAGEDNKPREIPFLGKSFAIDIENGSMGRLLIGEGIREWKSFPINSVPLPSPGPNFKRGFSILLYAPKLLGSAEAHEMCSSTGAHMSFCERLYNEAEPNFGKGNMPIVKITEAEPVKVGKGKSRELHFEIVKWVPRPAAITEALAKLRAAGNVPPKNNRPADAPDDDFDDEDVTTATPEEKPEAEKSAKEKPKPRGKKAPPEQSDLLDEIPFA
jgi:hypothetical protein